MNTKITERTKQKELPGERPEPSPSPPRKDYRKEQLRQIMLQEVFDERSRDDTLHAMQKRVDDLKHQLEKKMVSGVDVDTCIACITADEDAHKKQIDDLEHQLEKEMVSAKLLQTVMILMAAGIVIYVIELLVG
ncbi:MAG: hypothetical protein GY799_28845 [Desulfobulbaceae bacterium]|nr:hypothetical protein [Desulfobulbaceae bacterium]